MKLRGTHLFKIYGSTTLPRNGTFPVTLVQFGIFSILDSEAYTVKTRL